ncbi:MAG: hypothetical protein E7556_09105 [Ruminococcaceae bacterium]|nr:hypothetical protein [Oscillospiraceae bacterium]
MSDMNEQLVQEVEVKEKKKKAPFIIGLIVIIFAIIGIVSVGIFIKDSVKENVTAEDDYSVYSKYLTWVVGIDPDPFTDITKADFDDLLNIAVCSLLTDGVKTDEYDVTEFGLVVPAADVEQYFRRWFGNDVQIVHATVQGYGYEFQYDANKNCYYVPLTGVVPPFTPRIESVSKTGGLVTLKVGYIGTNNIEVSADGTIAPAQPDKFMEIKLKETADGGFNLISIVSMTQGEYQ